MYQSYLCYWHISLTSVKDTCKYQSRCAEHNVSVTCRGVLSVVAKKQDDFPSKSYSQILYMTYLANSLKYVCFLQT